MTRRPPAFDVLTRLGHILIVARNLLPKPGRFLPLASPAKALGQQAGTWYATRQALSAARTQLLMLEAEVRLVLAERNAGRCHVAQLKEDLALERSELAGAMTALAAEKCARAAAAADAELSRTRVNSLIDDHERLRGIIHALYQEMAHLRVSAAGINGEVNGSALAALLCPGCGVDLDEWENTPPAAKALVLATSHAKDCNATQTCPLADPGHWEAVLGAIDKHHP